MSASDQILYKNFINQNYHLTDCPVSIQQALNSKGTDLTLILKLFRKEILYQQEQKLLKNMEQDLEITDCQIKISKMKRINYSIVPNETLNKNIKIFSLEYPVNAFSHSTGSKYKDNKKSTLAIINVEYINAVGISRGTGLKADKFLLKDIQTNINLLQNKRKLHQIIVLASFWENTSNGELEKYLPAGFRTIKNYEMKIWYEALGKEIISAQFENSSSETRKYPPNHILLTNMISHELAKALKISKNLPILIGMPQLPDFYSNGKFHSNYNFLNVQGKKIENKTFCCCLLQDKFPIIFNDLSRKIIKSRFGTKTNVESSSSTLQNRIPNEQKESLFHLEKILNNKVQEMSEIFIYVIARLVPALVMFLIGFYYLHKVFSFHRNPAKNSFGDTEHHQNQPISRSLAVLSIALTFCLLSFTCIYQLLPCKIHYNKRSKSGSNIFKINFSRRNMGNSLKIEKNYKVFKKFIKYINFRVHTISRLENKNFRLGVVIEGEKFQKFIKNFGLNEDVIYQNIQNCDRLFVVKLPKIDTISCDEMRKNYDNFGNVSVKKASEKKNVSLHDDQPLQSSKRGVKFVDDQLQCTNDGDEIIFDFVELEFPKRSVFEKYII